MGEKKNKTYAGQVADIARKDVHLSFTDRLSRMTEEEGDPFLNIFCKINLSGQDFPF